MRHLRCIGRVKGAKVKGEWCKGEWLIFKIDDMYVILVYDIGEKRVGKMLKLCRQYVNWIQNSVFEGEISEVKLKELILRARLIMKMEEHDSLIIFKSRDEKWLEKQVIGEEKNDLNQFL